jgi:hypothetical protein
MKDEKSSDEWRVTGAELRKAAFQIQEGGRRKAEGRKQ